MDETAVIAAIFTKLQADTTLRGSSYLNDATFPYSIYRHNFVPDTPAFPIVTVEWLGGPSVRSGAWEDNISLVTIRVYHGKPALIHARIERLLNQRVQVLTASNAELRMVRKTAKGSDLWDDEYQVHYRPETYEIRYRLHGGINLNTTT